MTKVHIFHFSHENDACLVNLNRSCVELSIDLSTPLILETRVTVMNASCDQTTEISTILSAPIKLIVDAKELMFNHFDMTSNLGDNSVSNDLFHHPPLLENKAVLGVDDEDMTTLDTTKNIAYMHIF